MKTIIIKLFPGRPEYVSLGVGSSFKTMGNHASEQSDYFSYFSHNFHISSVFMTDIISLPVTVLASLQSN